MRITAIIPHKSNPAKSRVFVDSRKAFVLSDKIIREKDLKPGTVLSPGEYNTLESLQKYCRALDYARLLLSYRKRSQKEITHRLISKGYREETAGRVVDQLKKEGQVNDGDFARWWIQNRRQTRPRGDFAIGNELKRKGVAGEVIDRAFEEIEREEPPDRSELAFRACRSMLKRYRSLDKNTARRRLRAFLKRRGFNFDTIRQTEVKFFSEND